MDPLAVCPCGSGIGYFACCGRFHGGQVADTPEQLMRSRYSAYALNQLEYIQATMREDAAHGFDLYEAQQRNQACQWLGLTVCTAPKAKGDKGEVSFIAQYQHAGQAQAFYEISQFKRVDGRWYYVSGVQPKLGRNDACPCGCGKKFKRHHC